MSEWIEIYINGEHSHNREINYLPLNKCDIEKISNFHRHQCSDYGSFLIEIYLQNGPLIFSTEMPSQALSLKAAWIKCADKMPELGVPVLVIGGSTAWVDKAYDSDDGVSFYEDNYGRVTHWMPLPATPVEVEQ